MFKPTQPLQARVAARLKGYRGPTLRLLRRVERTVHPAARLRAFNAPGRIYFNRSPKGVRTLQAWKKLDIPLPRLLPRFTGEKDNAKTLFSWSADAPGKAAEDANTGALVSGNLSPDAVAAAHSATVTENLPKLCQRIRKPVETSTTTTVSSILTPEATRKQIQARMGGAFAARHNPPVVERWAHDLYFYNKETAKDLVVTCIPTKKLIKSYYNMVPQGFGDVEKRLVDRKNLLRSSFRAFTSDGIRNKQPIKQDLIGKVSDRNRQSFYHPMKRLASTQVNMHFKYTAQTVKIMTQTYDRRIEILKHRLGKLERHLRQATKLNGPAGWALFARTCELLQQSKVRGARGVA